jgi:uncharacterized membrane protein HdeD (DUF308 family)
MYVPEISTIKDSISHWYIVFTVGLVFLAAGLLILIRPHEAMVALATLLGIAFLFAGIIEIYFAFANRTAMTRWTWPLVFGILTALVGIFFIGVPEFTVLVMTLALGLLVVFRSIAAVSFSMDVRLLGGKYWWVYMLLAIIGIFFSFALIMSHLLMKDMINEWTGLSLLTVGVYNVFIGLRLRKLKGVSNHLSDELLAKYYSVRQEIREELSRLEEERRINS